MTAPQPSDDIRVRIREAARREVALHAPEGFASPQIAAEIGALLGDLGITEQAEAGDAA